MARQNCPLCGSFLPAYPDQCPRCKTEFDIPRRITRCQHCGVAIEQDGVYGWVDAGTELVYCHDQDETQDGIRHEAAR